MKVCVLNPIDEFDQFSNDQIFAPPVEGKTTGPLPHVFHEHAWLWPR